MVKKILNKLLNNKTIGYECGIINDDYSTHIKSFNEAEKIIKNLIISEKPMLLSRIGVIELAAINNYISNKISVDNNGWQLEYRKKKLHSNAGFYFNNENELINFCKINIEVIRNCDLFAPWKNQGEDILLSLVNPNAILIPPRSIEPYYSETPWTSCIKDKKVLIINPFTETINKQYKKKEQLFPNSEILPNFKLITLKSVQSIGIIPPKYPSWFNALDEMKEKINNINFDIAIIGAGAYGPPLGLHIKTIGKKAIIMGGATQILFGIKGKRWDNHPIISKFFNEHWTRPSFDETPALSKNVEDGCYW